MLFKLECPVTTGPDGLTSDTAPGFSAGNARIGGLSIRSIA
ncbi:hypothetical protein [Maioricimonas rarisocia]|nr:hypothetical protein [Maioricimonas rarisocia]